MVFGFDEHSTQRIATSVRKTEADVAPFASKRRNPAKSQPQVLWLCRTTSILAKGSQGTVDILSGPVGSESQLNTETLVAKNSFSFDIPINTNVWVAPGRVFGNASNDKWYVISTDQLATILDSVPLHVAVIQGNRIGSGHMNLTILRSTGAVGATGTTLTFAESGWYFFSFNMLISSFDRTAGGAGNRADVIYGSFTRARFLIGDVPFAEDQSTSLFTGLGALAIDPINPSNFGLEREGFSGAQLAPRYVIPGDTVSLEVLTDGSHQFISDVSVLQIRKQP